MGRRAGSRLRPESGRSAGGPKSTTSGPCVPWTPGDPPPAPFTRAGSDPSVRLAMVRGNPGSRGGWLVLVGWAAAAVGFASTGWMARLPPPAVPALIWVPVIAGALLYWRLPSVRRFARAIDLRAILVFHLLRGPIGAAFLVLESSGELAPEFARVAGPGDLAVAVFALGLLPFVGRDPGRARTALLAWNVLGLVDMIAVFVGAQRVLFFGGGMEAMRGFFAFPFPAIPTFVVPVVLLTHLLVFVRLRRSSA